MRLESAAIAVPLPYVSGDPGQMDSERVALRRECFFGRDRRYHHARRRFVYKLGEARACTSAALSAPGAV